jgi:predicted transcriptional regulator
MLSANESHARKRFYQHEDLTEEYRQNFSKPGVIGYYAFPDDPKEKTYCLCLDNGEIIVLGDSLASADKCLQDIYYADQLDFWESEIPAETNAEQKEEFKAVKITPKRQELLNQVNKIKTWGRGVIAKIASNLGRKVGAVRQMLSVLTKKGLLIRIRRGQYALSSEQLALI